MTRDIVEINAAVTRRDAVRAGATGVGAIALLTMPIALSATARNAMAQAGANASLQLVAKIEYLQAAFYSLGLTAFSTGAQAFTAGESTAIQQIAKHENAHVPLIKSILGSAAPPQPAPASYDFTAGSGTKTGPFPASLTTKTEFLKVAQLLEDAGVRAYKGILTSFGSDKGNLATVAGIHQVEARHAAIVRRLRNQNAWIAGAAFDAGFTGPAATPGTQASVALKVYGTAAPDPLVVNTGEDNRVQGSIANQNAESFDEPLASADVLAFAALFGVS
jgi:hypothetical protein